MIHWKNKKVIPYYTDYKPANVYKGSSAVALAKRMTGSGAVNEFRTEYKSTPIKRIVGQSVQESGTKKAAHVMGKTYKYNQLDRDENNENWNFNRTPTSAEQINTRIFSAKADNYYAVFYYYKNMPVQTTNYAIFQIYDSQNAIIYNYANDNQISGSGHWRFIFKVSKDTSALQLRFRVNGGIAYNCSLTRMLVNITEIYGAGKEQTVMSQFLSDYPMFNSYVPYQPTSILKSVVLNEVTYCGENLNDESKMLNNTTLVGGNATVFDEFKTTDYIWCYGMSNISLNYGQSYAFYDKNKNVILSDDKSLTIERHYAVPNGAYYFRSSHSTKTFNGAIVINEGTTLLPYSPYNGQTITFSTPVTINGLAIQDDIYSYVEGNELVTKKVTRYSKNTITNVTYKSSSPNNNYLYDTGIGNAEYVSGVTPDILSSSLTTRFFYTLYIQTIEGVAINSDNHIYIALPESSGANTVNLAKQYLESHPINIVYKLKTPTITEISRVPLVCDFDDVTNIIVSNENAGLADPDTSYSMDPFPTPYIPSEVVSSSKIDIQHNNHYYAIDGLTEKWNQMFPDIYPNIFSGDGVTVVTDRDNKTYTCTVTLQRYGGGIYFTSNYISYNTNDKYLISCQTYSEYPTNLNYRFINKSSDIIIAENTWVDCNAILKAENNVLELDIDTRNIPIGSEFKHRNFVLVDLTSIFGSGNEPTSVDDPRIQRLIEIAKRRPQYDEGSLLSASKIYDQDDNLLYELSDPIKSAGDAHDVLCTNGQVKVNMGDVDLGTLDWITDTVITNRFVASFADWHDRGVRRSIGSCSSLLRVIMDGSGYDAAANNVLYGTLGNIYVQTTDYQNPAAFKTAMQGVILIYELAGPTTRQAASMYLPAGLTFHDEYGRSLTSTYKEEILTDVIDIESSGIGTATDEIWVNRASSNLWDEEWRLVYGAYVTNTNRVIVEENTYYTFISPAIYWIDVRQLDADGVQISASSKVTNTPFKTEIGCKYIRFYLPAEYGTTYNHDIAIVEGKTGTYEPYAKGKVISIQRIGKVDLGTLSWNKYTNTLYPNKWLFYASVDDGVSKGSDERAFIKVSGYSSYNYVLRGTNMLETGLDKTAFWNATIPQIVISDSSITDAASFKAAVSGTILYYELANPVIKDITNTSLGQALLAKTYPNANHRISIDLGSIDVQWFEAK